MKFNNYKIGKRNNLISTNFTHTWALANYFANGDKTRPPSSDDQLINEETRSREDKQNCTGSSTDTNGNDSALSVKEQDLTCKSEKVPKNDGMPTWAATNSLLLSQSPAIKQPHTCTNTAVVAPLFKSSPTDYGTLYTILQLTQGISAKGVGLQRRTIITLDLDLYSRALKIQQSVGNKNWILRAGALHIAFAALHALGKTIDGSGLDTCAIESGAYTSAALRGIFGGKAYKRGVEYHITNSLAIVMLRFDAIFSNLSEDPICMQCIDLKDKLHERQPEVVEIFGEIQAWYTENVKPLEDKQDIGEFAEFLLKYLEQVESILNFISSCRTDNWEGYLSSLENLIKYFFARDLLNYARLMPVHLAQMNALETEDPETWSALKSGGFVVAKSRDTFHSYVH